MMSLAVTPGWSAPVTSTRNVFGVRWSSVCVARTISISLVPMPKASAPNAPWVAVWESPQTMVIPGCVSPSSGPITWTMPRLGEPWPWNGIPNCSQLSRIWRSCLAASSSAIGMDGSVVGIE